jgi:hypothetical protein
MNNIGFKYYKFGSQNSLDNDYLIDHPNSTGNENDVSIIRLLKSQFLFIEDWDINIIKIENGIVINSIPSKGSTDSVNNSLFETYQLHEQKFEFPLKRKLDRNKLEAIRRCVNAILTFYKNTDQNDFYETVPRKVLKPVKSLVEQLEVLKEYDFDKLPPFINEAKNVEKFKKIGFHIGQTIALIDDSKEIYTKEELIAYNPDLKDVINRKLNNSYSILNEKLDLLNRKATEYIALNPI